MALPYNPSSAPYGCFVFVINSVNYVGETASPSLPTTMIDRKTELGAPGDFILIGDRITGSATLQLATATTVLPQRGQNFALDLQHAGSNQNYVVSNVSPVFPQGGMHAVTIDYVFVS